MITLLSSSFTVTVPKYIDPTVTTETDSGVHVTFSDKTRCENGMVVVHWSMDDPDNIGGTD